jgi:GNAT superfamily N-acetyltransferase
MRDELSTVVAAFDQEFLTRKGRSLSLARRFPNALSSANRSNILVARCSDQVCGALAIRFFDWLVREQCLRGGMVGMVWVDASHRGKGVGSSLLRAARQHLEVRADIGVLWTGTPTFYENAGWVSHDLGLLAEVGTQSATRQEVAQGRSTLAFDPSYLETWRSRLFTSRVVRSAQDYRTVPLPAAEVICETLPGDHTASGVALIGKREATGFFYEMIAPSESWEPLWARVVSMYGTLVVNGISGDPFSEWLRERNLVTWTRSQKAMWLALSAKGKSLALEELAIPFFDWI